MDGGLLEYERQSTEAALPEGCSIVSDRITMRHAEARRAELWSAEVPEWYHPLAEYPPLAAAWRCHLKTDGAEVVLLALLDHDYPRNPPSELRVLEYRLEHSGFVSPLFASPEPDLPDYLHGVLLAPICAKDECTIRQHGRGYGR